MGTPTNFRDLINTAALLFSSDVEREGTLVLLSCLFVGACGLLRNGVV